MSAVSRKHGFVEIYNRQGVGGWIVDESGDIPTVQIKVNAEIVGTCHPTIERPDLEGRLAGFFFKFPEECIPEHGKAVRVEVLFDQTNRHLGNSPLVFSMEANAHQKVLKGKDGFLFLHADSNRVIDQISGKVIIHPEQENKWREILSKRRQLCGEQGISLLHLVVPDKERVYADKLPDSVAVTGDSHSIYAQWRAILPEISVIYPINALKMRTPFDTYSKGDTHWNSYGAYCVFQMVEQFFEPTSRHRWRVEPGQFQMAYSNADLLGKLGGLCIEPQVFLPWHLCKYKVLADNKKWLTGRKIHFASTWPQASAKRILCMHDSFAPYMERMLATSFAECMFIWGVNVDWEEVERFRPDAILIEQVERFLVRAPDA